MRELVLLVVALLQHFHAKQPRVEVDGALDVAHTQHRVREPEGGRIDGLVVLRQRLVGENLCQGRFDGFASMGVDCFDAGIAELRRRHGPDLGHEQNPAVGEHAAHRVARVFFLVQGVTFDVPARDERCAFSGDIIDEELPCLSEVQIDGRPVAARDRNAKRGRGGGGFGAWALERIGGHGVFSSGRNLKKARATFVPDTLSRLALPRHGRT